MFFFWSQAQNCITAPSPKQYADEWREFGQQPGTRLSWVRTGARHRELRTADQQTVASVRYAAATLHFLSFGGNYTLSAGGRTFTLNRATKSAWPGIAETISCDRLGAGRNLQRQTDDRAPFQFLRQLLDEAGTAVLYRSGVHQDRRARSYISFPGQRWLRFPVRGTKRANAIMTAVDQAGNKVARYRFAGSRKTIESTVHPDHRLTDELALTICVSAPWMGEYFVSSPGGG